MAILPIPLIAISPFQNPDPKLVMALDKANVMGVLDPGYDPEVAREAIHRLVAAKPRRLGVVGRDSIDPALIPFEALIILPGPLYPVADWAPRSVLAQVTSLDEARRAEEAGAIGLIAKGSESGGRVGDESSFILLQRLLRSTRLPVWVQGGIGPHTAAACIAGGAEGVVLDSQLALARESSLPADIKQAVAVMDGSESTVMGGYRVFLRPDLKEVTPEREEDVVQRLGAGSLKTHLLPCGQDGALAANLAERYVTAGSIVTAIADMMAKAPSLARDLRILEPGAALASHHGIRYPILQGPMTRVSDTAEFAAAVAQAGGLPFVALALLRGKAVRNLLVETQALLGDRPWGVGLLGFADPALRAEQLAAVEEIKPPVAIIAGGRPSQARALEDQGIATYLHVPSPGLLKLFLADGARRFIFEGRECGGHVGPRSSFALWEQQLQILSRFDQAAELCLVFAGGIHDARSAAMVAAMTAPLAARGARIGVLMGTAYLYTEEAVTSGAILPAYQQAAVDCHKTMLLETGPGHASRCVDTDFVRFFNAERQRLLEEGLDQESIWRHLEQLNLGRLRIASKGVKREGETLVPVAAAEQRREGMYMIGDVAMMQDQVTTMAELHRRVTVEACDYLASLPAPPATQVKPAPVDIAIIGMAAVFPGAHDLEEYWSNVVKGLNAVTEVDPERWNPAFYYDPNSANGDKTPTKWGGFIDDVIFNPMDYGIPPSSLTAIDPTQLLGLEMARRALDDAGYAGRDFDRSRVSVVFGAESGADISASYGFRSLYPQLMGPLPAALDEHLPRLTEDSFPGVLANVIAGRIANRLDLGGANFTVDAACASSLAALDMAIKELVLGTSDLVLCGGADLHNGIHDYLLFAGVHALSRADRCRTFDSEADGTVLGEGVGCLVLKRLADAERDGDRIYAVVKAIASSSDGRSLGLTAPRKEGQMRALQRVFARAGLTPRQVGLVEAHGTGTVVGDRTELSSLNEAFGAAGAEAGACGLGSVKSQIGHTKCAAGLAGLIKVAKALHHRVLPPTINIRKPNPAWDPATSPFAISDRARPWLLDERHATVNAFGFGGANFTTVLSAYGDGDEPGCGYAHWPCELFLFRGADRQEAMTLARKVLALLDSGQRLALRDLAATLSQSADQQVQFFLVAGSVEELREGIHACLAGKGEGSEPAARPLQGKLAFLFPGQGSQRPGMLRELFVAFPHLHRLLELGAPWRHALFPPTAWSDEQRARQKAEITDTRTAQPALGMVGLAMADLFGLAGIRPDLAAGHSYGELVALCLAGVFSEHDLLRLSHERALAMLAAAGDEPGTMAAVAASAERITGILAGLDGVVLANLNAPDQTVISGSQAVVTQAVDLCKAQGLSAQLLPVAAAFHSPIVAGGSDRLRAYLAGLPLGLPAFPVWSNTSAAPHAADPDLIRDLLAVHIARPVRFVEQIESMYAAGARLFVEVGPGKVLSGLVSRILGDREHVAMASDSGGDSSIRDFLTALGRLAALGVPVDTRFMFDGRGAKGLDLDAPDRLAPPEVAWKINGWLARPIKGQAPKNRLRPTLNPVFTPGTPGLATPAAPTTDREATVLEYLRGIRELAMAQRDVMLGYLGAPLLAHPLAVRTADQLASLPAPGTLAELIPATLAAPSSTVKQPMALTETLLGIVSDKTGYPAEMLGLDLDLEAELSIDSIKRVEVLGALAERLGLDARGGDRDYIIEQLAAKKTLREIIVWLEQRPQGATTEPAAVATEASPATAPKAMPDITQTLLGIVSDKTGYPVEMLGLDQDLEAELSIDSIKRVEILGALAEQLGLGDGRGGDRDYMIEQLAARKTLREILKWLEKSLNGGADTSSAASSTQTATAAQPVAPAQVPAQAMAPSAGTEGSAALMTRRYVPVIQPIGPADADPGLLAGKRFFVTEPASSLGRELIAALNRLGAIARGLEAGQALPPCQGLVYLGALRKPNGIEPAKDLFDLAKEAIGQGAHWLYALTGFGGRFIFGQDALGDIHGAGIAGLIKSAAKEHPDRRMRVLDIDPREEPARIAEYVLAELTARDGLTEVGCLAGQRYRVTHRTANLDTAPAAAPALNEGSLVLVTGGARGITARAAVEIGLRTRCRLILVGRSPLPGPEDPSHAAAKDLTTLRNLLIKQGQLKEPRAIEAACRRILADREARSTFDALKAFGIPYEYHSLDVRDDKALTALIDDIYHRYGHIDTVIHGAGIIEDKLLIEKPRDSFDRVFDTKVASARTLLTVLREDVKSIVFFSSISGAVGNRGQSDYAAAGDVLDKLAWDYAKRGQSRVLSIDWGPWASTGMVSDELAREYARRGIGLIPLSEGIDMLLKEMGAGPKEQVQVIIAAADPDLLFASGAKG